MFNPIKEIANLNTQNALWQELGSVNPAYECKLVSGSVDMKLRVWYA